MRYFFTGLFSILLTTFSFSQNFKITGTLLDDETGDFLESATIFLETAKDSTLITYSISDRQGKFTLGGNTGNKHVRLNISYIGYQNFQKEFELESTIDLGEIKLLPATDYLDEVVIQSRAPVVIKRDTLEFNVASFKTKQDATIEDLLKQLPGVEVALDGTIKVNGKPVSEIMVNGKPFFGDDPTIATRNLTKEMIDKIQITDTKTESQAFTGEAGDQESKTINLTVKEDKNRGVFGRVAAGAGTNKRYEFAGLVNYFDNDRRVSALLGGNNINSPGFSFGEIQKMFGGGRSMWRSNTGAFGIDGRNFGSNVGIVESRLWGANYADVVTKGFDVSADYFHSGSNAQNDSRFDRENILPDRRYFTESETTSRSESDTDQVNMKFDIKIDSTFLINIRPAFSYSKRMNDRTNETASFNEDRIKTNEAHASSHSESSSRNFRNRLSLTKKYGSRGGFFRATLNNKWNTDSGEDFQYSTTTIYGDNPSEEIRNQRGDTKNKETSYDAAATLQYPIYKNELFVDLTYSFSNSKTLSSKFVNDFDENTRDFTSFNSLLSTDYIFTETRSKPTASLTYRADGKNFRIGGGYVIGKLEGSDNLRPDLMVENKFEAWEAHASSYMKLSPVSNFNIYYSLRSRSPSIMQLLPSIDVSNPLHTIIGNPDLKPSQSQTVYAGFYTSDFQKGTNIYINLNGEFTDNAVVSKSVIDENNVRTTTYENVDGNRRFNPSVYAEKKFTLDTIRSITIGAGAWSALSRNVNFNNGVQYVSKNNTYGPNMKVNFAWEDVVELEMEYDWDFSKSRYRDNIFPERNYAQHTLRLETDFFVLKNLDWNNSVEYTYNPDVQVGFQKSSWLWNSAIEYAVMKEKGIISLKVYDLLNQNTTTMRSSSENYIEDRETTMLRRYFMVGFSYKFNSMKGKPADSNSGRGRF